MAGTAESSFLAWRARGRPRDLADAYDRVAPDLLALALHLVGEAAAAEDVVQSTFLAAMESADGYDATRPLAPWLAGILRNRVLELRRARARAPEDAADPDAEPAPERDDAADDELREVLAHAIARLPAAWRPVLELRLRHGLAASEIAAALGRPPGTVRSQLARGIEELRRRLPVGLAGALSVFAARPARGHAAVRDAVLAAAPAQTVTATLAAALGALAMKKLVLVASVALVATGVLLVRGPLLARGAISPAEEAIAAAPSAGPLDSAGEDAPPRPISARAAAEDGRAKVVASTEPPDAVEPAHAAAPARLVVRVRWEDGGPVAGEVVLVRRVDRRDGVTSDPLATADVELRTDARGRVALDALDPGLVQVQSLRGGLETVRASAGGVSEVDFRLEPALDVVGAVTDPRGAPVPGAELLSSLRWSSGERVAVVGRADAAGRFRVEGLTPDHWLSARAPGHANARQQQVRGLPGAEVRAHLVLDRVAATVHGRVVDPDGAPVERAVLVADALDADEGWGERDGVVTRARAPARATTDGDGRFTFAHVPLGAVRLRARAPGSEPHVATVEVPRAGSRGVEVVLRPGASVSGVVRDAAGEPVGRARVQAGSGFGSAATYTASDGSYALAGLARGPVELVARERDRGEARAEVDLSGGGDRTWSPTLEPTLAIRGTLADAEGAPVEGTWVVAQREAGDTTTSSRTDADGRFVVAPLEDAAYRVVVHGPGGWRSFPLLLVEGVRPGGAALELVLAEDALDRGGITGALLDPDGAPLPAARLQVWHEERRLWREADADPATGRVEVEGVPPGAVHLTAVATGYGRRDVGRHAIVAGERLDLGDVRFAPAGALEVRVVGMDGGALADATAFCIPRGADASWANAVLEGDAFVARGLAEGRWAFTLRAEHRPYVEREVEVRAGATTSLELDLPRVGMRPIHLAWEGDAPDQVACDVRTEAGDLVWRARVLRQGPGGAIVARVSAAAGRYAFAARDDDGRTARGTVTLTGADEDPAVPALLLPDEPDR